MKLNEENVNTTNTELNPTRNRSKYMINAANYRVARLSESEDEIMLRLTCECLDSDHDVTLHVEYDEDIRNAYLNMYNQLRWASWASRPLHYWLRFKAAVKLMFTGYLEVESGLILGNKEHVISLINALGDCLSKMDREVVPIKLTPAEKEGMDRNTLVHVSHCCVKHGCKYGDTESDPCPVLTKEIRQQYLCEDCYQEG